MNLYFISHNQELLNQSIKALKAELDSVGILNDPFLIELKQALETYVKGIHFLEPNNFKNQTAKTIEQALVERCVGVRQFVGIKPQDFSKIKEDAKSQNRCFLSVNNKALAPDQVYTLLNCQGQEVSIEGKETIDGFLSNKAILELLASHVNGFELDIAYVNGRGQDFGKYSLQSNATLYGRLTASLDENIQNFGRLRTDGTTLDGTYNFIGDNDEDLKGALNQINYRHELVFLQDSQGEIDCVVEKVIKGVCSIFYTQANNPTVLEKEKEPLRHFLSSLKGYLTCVARDDESYKRVLLSEYDNIDTIEEGREGRKQLFIECFAVSLKNKHFDDSKNALVEWCRQVRVKPQALEDTEEAQGKTADVRQFLEDYQRVVSIPKDQLQHLKFDDKNFEKSEVIAKWIINSCIGSNTPHAKFGYNKEGEWVEQGLQKKDLLVIDDMFKVFVGREATGQEKNYLRSKFVDTLKHGHKRDTDSVRRHNFVKDTHIALEIFGAQKVFGKASTSINAGGHHVQIYDATKETLGTYIDVARNGNNPKSLKQLLNLDSVQYTASSGEKKAIVCPLHCEYIKDMFAALRSNTKEVKKLLDEGGISAYDSLKKSVSVVTDSLVEAKKNHLIISERKLLEIMRLYDGLSVRGRENELKEFKAYVSHLNLSSEEITKMDLAIRKNVYRSSELEGLIKQDKVVGFETFIKGLNPREAWG